MSRTRSEAIKYLDSIAEVQYSDQITNIIPRFTYDYPIEVGSGAIGAEKVKNVPVDKIYTRQTYVSINVVKKKIRGKFKQHWPEYPHLIKYNNKYYVIDGNHRVCKSIALDRKIIRAKVYVIK